MALTDGLISVWHLNENSGESLVADSFGSNDGVRTGATQDIADKMLGAASLDFDSIDDNVVVPHDISLAPDFISISTWVKPRVDSAQQSIIEKPFTSFSGSIYDYFLRAFTPNSNIGWFVTINGTLRVLQSNSHASANNWHHVVATYDGSYLRLYIDGYFRAISPLHSGTITKSGEDLRFGEHEHLASQKLDGNMDEVNMWNRALTDGSVSINTLAGEEVAELWNGGAGIEVGVAAAAGRRRRMLVGRA